jgi:hypothetical protein
VTLEYHSEQVTSFPGIFWWMNDGQDWVLDYSAKTNLNSDAQKNGHKRQGGDNAQKQSLSQ